MGLSNSPSLKDYRNGMPDQPHKPAVRQRIIRITLAVLTVIVAALGVINFMGTDSANLLIGNGNVTGHVVDAKGAPFPGTVYVMGVDRPVLLDAQGGFTYQGVPAGRRNLIVALNGTAQEYPVQVQAGANVDVGQLIFTVVTPIAQP